MTPLAPSRIWLLSDQQYVNSVKQAFGIDLGKTVDKHPEDTGYRHGYRQPGARWNVLAQKNPGKDRRQQGRDAHHNEGIGNTS
jgi:hypothetical protein